LACKDAKASIHVLLPCYLHVSTNISVSETFQEQSLLQKRKNPNGKEADHAHFNTAKHENISPFYIN
jgi:hypothetical protein